MRIHRLIPLLIVLIVLALTTITTFKHIPIAVESSTAVAQEDGEVKEEPMEADGFSTYPATETTEETACDLYLDAAEVERRALEEQAADGQRDSGATTSPGRFPISFKHVPLHLPGGIDHAAAGVATRHSGHGVIRLRGVPIGATLISAHLVWGEITAVPGNYSVGFGPVCSGGTTYQGIVYGLTTQPCWNTAGVYAGLIANVTSAILPGINGDYQVKGLKSFPFGNQCPWSDPACGPSSNALVLSEGASLIVIYSHPNIPPQAQIYVHLGPRMFLGTHTAIHPTNTPILPGMQTVKHTRIGADGQVTRSFGTDPPQLFVPDPSCGLRSNPIISNEQTWIGGNVPVQIKGNGSPFNQDSDWNGDDGEPMNKLWDTHTDVFMNSNFLAATPNNYTVKYVSGGDCIVWAVHILGIR